MTVRFYVNIGEELDKKFRHIIVSKKGYKQGNITQAVEEAIKLWIDKNG